MSDVLEIKEKRAFWHKVLIAGILIVFISLLTLVVLYFSGMNAAKADMALESDLEMAIAEHAARYSVISDAAKWTLPFAILGSLVLNVARFRLRKLKKLEQGLLQSPK